MRCDIIIIICRAEQIPFFKMRYGDSFLDLQFYKNLMNQEQEKFFSTKKTLKARPVSIYYVAPGDKYFYAQNDAFKSIEIASLFVKAVDESFEAICPTHFCFIFPYIMIHPIEFIQKDSLLRFACFQSSFPVRDVGSRFSLATKNKETNNLENLPNGSYTFMKIEEINEIWKNLKNLYTQKDFDEIRKLKFNEIIAPYLDKEFQYEIRKENVYDLRYWSEYVKYLNFLQNEERINVQNKINHLSKKTVSLTNITYYLDAPKTRDDKFFLRKSDFKKVSKKIPSTWKRRRDLLKNKEGKN